MINQGTTAGMSGGFIKHTHAFKLGPGELLLEEVNRAALNTKPLHAPFFPIGINLVVSLAIGLGCNQLMALNQISQNFVFGITNIGSQTFD